MTPKRRTEEMMRRYLNATRGLGGTMETELGSFLAHLGDLDAAEDKRRCA